MDIYLLCAYVCMFGCVGYCLCLCCDWVSWRANELTLLFNFCGFHGTTYRVWNNLSGCCFRKCPDTFQLLRMIHSGVGVGKMLETSREGEGVWKNCKFLFQSFVKTFRFFFFEVQLKYGKYCRFVPNVIHIWKELFSRCVCLCEGGYAICQIVH